MNIIFKVILPIAVALVVAFLWILILDPELDGLESEIDLNALNQLNLIIGFLYIALIRESREKWKMFIRNANEYIIACSMLLSFDITFKNDIAELTENLNKYLGTPDDNVKKQLNLLQLITKQTYKLLEKSKDNSNLNVKELIIKIKHVTESMDRQYFTREPGLFIWHLRALLILYFGSIPAGLFSHYGRTGTLVIYPIMIYFLFAVVIWSNAYENPLKHPEIVPRFKKLMESYKNMKFETYNDNETVLGKRSSSLNMLRYG